ncbi:hypothetical protein A2U01_0045366, partial [Trifolium medium]|nr:hypothetical protein [Trifolium medium]
YPQKQTWFLGASYHRKLITVCPDAERLNRLNTYSSPAALLVLFGHLSVLGLALHRWILMHYQITLFSSLIQQAVFELVVPFCNSSSLFACGLCGTRETIDYSEAQQFITSHVGQDQASFL